MNKGIFKKYKDRYDSYHIGGGAKVGVYYYLPPRFTVHTMSPMFPMVDINIRLAFAAPQGYLSFCKRKRWNQITQLVPGAHFLVARDVLARMWVYNRINIFIYFVFVFVCLVVGSRNPEDTRQINNKHKTNNE